MIFKQLKYCISCFLVGMSLISCSENEPDAIDASSEVTFDVHSITRATNTTSSNLTKVPFAVYGDMKLTDNPIVIFNKTKVSHNGTAWVYDNKQYWFPRHEHSFVAIHPYSVLESPDNAANDDAADNAAADDAAGNPLYSNSKLTFTYSLPTNDSGEVIDSVVMDILAATHRRLYNIGDVNTPATFRFGHIMSQINFTPALKNLAAPDTDYIEIHRLELTGFKTQATYDILPASLQSGNQTDDRVIDVTAQQGSGHLVIDFNPAKKIINKADDRLLFEGNDAIIMLPQTFASSTDAELIITFTENGSKNQVKMSAPLTDFVWQMGKRYNYKFTVSTGLTFQATNISDWDVADYGTITLE